MENQKENKQEQRSTFGNDESSALWSQLEFEHKIDLLKEAWKYMHDEFNQSSSLENKGTMVLCTLLILVPGFLIKKDFSPTLSLKISFVILCISFMSFGLWFLYRNAKRIRVIAKSMIRIEQLLGFYQENVYLSKDDVEILKNIPYSSPTVFLPDYQTWGSNDWLLSFSPHAGAVTLTGIASCSVLFLL